MTGQRGTLSIRALEAQQLLPEELTYQSKLRAAMSGAVGESDVTDVVKEIVAKAKSGDRHAQKLFFEYLVGVKNAPTKISVHNHYPDVSSAGSNVEREAREMRERSLAAKRNGHRVGIGADDADDN
jgi:hypothetical protein